jgi:alpha-beta hydrolase superfamily lysophospholipase
MMMPLATWLHNVDDEGRDILILESERNSMYVRGVSAFSDSLPATFEALHAFVTKNRYSEVTVVGPSVGALPALLAGYHVGARRVLLAGAIDPNLALWREFLPAGELVSRLTDAQGRAGATAKATAMEVFLLYGSLDRKDTHMANALVPIVKNARVIPVKGADHNCLFPLAQRGELAPLMRQFLEPAAS